MIGPLLPSRAVGAGWQEPENVQADDGVTARWKAVADEEAAALRAYGYGFAIPAAATVTGIEARVRRRSVPGGLRGTLQLTKAGAGAGSAKGLSAPDVERVVNGDFETDISTWSASIFGTLDTPLARTTDWAHSGVASMRFSVTDTNATARNNDVRTTTGVGAAPVPAGGTVTLAARLNVLQSSTTGYRLRVYFYSAAGVNTSTVNGPYVTGTGLRAMQHEFAVPSTGAASASWAISASIGTDVGTTFDAYIDAVTTAVAAPWTSLVEEFVVGGSADLWGTTWTPEEINADDFGAQLVADAAAGEWAEIDVVSLTVAYSMAGLVTSGDVHLFTSPVDAVYLRIAGPSGGDTTPPIITFISQSRGKISGVAGRDSTDVVFQANEDLQAWKAKVVPASDSSHTAGTLIEAGGAASSGAQVNFNITKDELLAAAAIEGSNLVKIFGQDTAGNWSSNV